jgi:DNA-binding CsgD family transcriptional regulator/PAS domain-containing protein
MVARGKGVPDPRHLVELAYHSAFEPRPFAALLPSLAAAVGADAAHINIRVPEIGGELTSSHEMPEQLIRSYREHHWRTDVWWHAFVRLRIPVGRPFTGHGIVPYRTLIKSEMYNDALRAYGLFDVCAGVLFQRGAAGAAVSLMRARGLPFYGRHETARLGAVLPHMARAFSFRLRLDELARQRDAFAAYIDNVTGGVFLIDDKGHVAHATDAARRFLDAPDAPLRLERGRLQARDPAADRRLQRLLANSAAWLLDRAVVALGPVCRMTITPAALAGGLLPQPTAFLAVVEPAPLTARSAVDAAAVKFSLTPAETELLAEIVAGRSLREAGERLSRAHTTVRNQLQSIFAKTGTHRQAELITRVLNRID